MRWAVMAFLLLAGCAGSGAGAPRSAYDPPLTAADWRRVNEQAAQRLQPGPAREGGPFVANPALNPGTGTSNSADIQRNHEYCRDLANQMATSVLDPATVLSSAIIGYDPRERRHYESCMSSFRRIERYLAP